MANKNLSAAKNAKKNEFYTQYADIQQEVNAYLEYDPAVFRGKTVLLPCDDPEWSNFTKFFAQNFETFGLKKLISTSYAIDAKNRNRSKATQMEFWASPVEQKSPQYDEKKSRAHGKIFILERDANRNGRIDIEDLEWRYLEGDGDFQSAEVTRLRDEADIIVTNPPFSLFREFLAWIIEADKKFLVIGNQNSITYKEVFPLIKSNRMWLGKGFAGCATHFISHYVDRAVAGKHIAGMIRVSGVVWFTNLDHGRRHQPMQLMTMEDNVKYSRHKKVRGKGYSKYDNYDAIEVPFSDAIPSDYDGMMGVPISFLDKFCPEQFEIVGNGDDVEWLRSVGAGKIGAANIAKLRSQGNKAHVTANMTSLCLTVDGRLDLPYKRIIIKARKDRKGIGK
ncbi:MAG: adenine-specific methyltransferase EcoRI family protein [Kiritimatiellia bacterium]